MREDRCAAAPAPPARAPRIPAPANEPERDRPLVARALQVNKRCPGTRVSSRHRTGVGCALGDTQPIAQLVDERGLVSSTSIPSSRVRCVDADLSVRSFESRPQRRTRIRRERLLRRLERHLWRRGRAARRDSLLLSTNWLPLREEPRAGSTSGIRTPGGMRCETHSQLSRRLPSPARPTAGGSSRGHWCTARPNRRGVAPW